jgi:hypothetical protein
MRFVVDEVLWRFFSFPLLIIIPPLLHSFITAP